MMNRGTLANFLTCSDLGVPARKTGFEKVDEHWYITSIHESATISAN